MRPDPAARPEYIAAFQAVAERIAESLRGTPGKNLPIRMYVGGGAAMHFYTGNRISQDIDAVFSHRIALPGDLEVSYQDADGAARLLYFDRQYNDSFALLHENAYDDSELLELESIDSGILNVRLLSAVDLTVSKISRLSSQDREDIAILANRGLISSEALCRRAEEATGSHVGNLDYLQTSIKLACHLVEEVETSNEATGQPEAIS